MIETSGVIEKEQGNGFYLVTLEQPAGHQCLCRAAGKLTKFRIKLLAGDKEKGDEVVNPFIDLVAKRAEGLPLFVNYVTQDVQQGNYPLDSTANLPKGLTAYHEKLIAGLGVGALQALLTPLVATLAMANEPLAEQEIITFLRLGQI